MRNPDTSVRVINCEEDRESGWRKEMDRLSQRIQSADWKNEKHVPVIDCPDKVKSDELFTVKCALGKAAAHPNTTEHHIRWISLYFQPDGEKFTYHVGQFEFAAHGESTKGANEGPVYANHEVSASMKVKTSGTLMALAYCNIHGVWESAREIQLA
jgi:superoxide reductase